MSKAKLERAIFNWCGTRLDELATHAGSGKARDRAYARASLDAEKARARATKLTKQKVGLARLYAADDLSATEYRTAMSENEAEMKAATEALAAAQSDMDRLAPVADIYETLIQWGEGHQDPAEYNVLLGKVIDRIDVTKQAIAVCPVVGVATNARAFDGQAPTLNSIIQCFPRCGRLARGPTCPLDGTPPHGVTKSAPQTS